MKKTLFYLLIALLVAVICFSLYQIIQINNEYQGGEDTYDELEQFVSTPTVADQRPGEEMETDPDSGETIPLETVPKDAPWPVVDFAALSQINDDIVGWICIPGSVVNYPIAQGSDNDYYLTHLFNGKRNSSGCIFLDATSESDFTSLNSVLHGHHMKNGSMFASICDYKDQAYYDEHPTAMLLTPNGNYKVYFFSGYVTNTKDDVWNSNFYTDDYPVWLEKLVSKSSFVSDVIPTAEDRVLTLSTCTYEYNNARYVLHGILVPVTES